MPRESRECGKTTRIRRFSGDSKNLENLEILESPLSERPLRKLSGSNLCAVSLVAPFQRRERLELVSWINVPQYASMLTLQRSRAVVLEYPYPTRDIACECGDAHVCVFSMVVTLQDKSTASTSTWLHGWYHAPLEVSQDGSHSHP